MCLRVSVLGLWIPSKKVPGYYAARIDPERRKRTHIRQLEALGYTVTLQPAT